jgi:ABC-type cobalamin transport system permease subunit
MNITAPFVRRPVATTTLLSIGVALAGAVSFFGLLPVRRCRRWTSRRCR